MDNSFLWDFGVFIDWLCGEDIGSVSFICEFISLVEDESENVFVVCNCDDGLDN